MSDFIHQFRHAMRTAGLEHPPNIEPGKFCRFPGISKHKSSRAGWCILFTDVLGGCFGDWSSGVSETCQIKRSRPFSQHEKAAFRKHLSEARSLAAKEREMMHAKAAMQAERIWNAAIPAPDSHPYLISKGIKANGARLYKGCLVLPIVDITGQITSLQFINPFPFGKKMLLSGGRKRGCFIVVAGCLINTPAPAHVIVCEGWATGCSLAKNQPNYSLVLAAVDAGNLKSVAVAIRLYWPGTELVIAADDDRLTHGNPGAAKAREAAIAAHALLALPQWPDDAPLDLTDFNDLAIWLEKRGLDHE